MRAFRFDRMLAGTVLAAAVAVPSLSPAAPRVETVYPAPPSLNGRVIRHHEPVEAPPAATRAQAQPREAAPLPPPAPQPAATRPEPAPAPAREADTKSGIDLSGALDRMFSASDAQITPKLKEFVTSKQFDKRVERPADRRAIEVSTPRAATRRCGSATAASPRRPRPRSSR